MESYTFKTVTFGGFDKQDVARYVEQLTQEHSAALTALQEENAALKEKNYHLEAENRSLRTQADAQAAALSQLSAQAEKLLEEGLGFAEALRQGEALPPAACTLLALGIRSGSGDTVIREIARRLTEEGENALREKAERVEPALVLAASVLVGIILLAVMLPLLRVMSALG